MLFSSCRPIMEHLARNASQSSSLHSMLSGSAFTRIPVSPKRARYYCKRIVAYKHVLFVAHLRKRTEAPRERSSARSPSGRYAGRRDLVAKMLICRVISVAVPPMCNSVCLSTCKHAIAVSTSYPTRITPRRTPSVMTGQLSCFHQRVWWLMI
jgi:hypothetical protein